MSTQATAMVNKLLTNVALGYKPTGFVAESIFAPLQFAQYSGLLGVYGKDFLRIENSHKGGKGAYRRVDSITRSTTQFHIEGHGLEDVVTKEDYANVELPFNAESDKVMALTMMLQIEKEKLAADTLTNASVITQNVTLSGSDQFNDYGNSDPLSVIVTGKKAVRTGCGQRADTMICDEEIAEVLKFHPALLDRLGFKENRPGGLSYDELARALELKRVLIASALYNSAKEGQTDVLAPIWGKDVVLGCFPTVPMIGQISAGYLVKPTGSMPRKVYKYAVNNPPGANAVLVEDEYDMLIAQAAAAYVIKAAIA